MGQSENRKYKRLAAKLSMVCRKVGCHTERSYQGCTENVSPGGLYFETEHAAFEKDSVFQVTLSIPPKSGLLEFGGNIATSARVLRKESLAKSSGIGKYGVALEFIRPPKLCP